MPQLKAAIAELQAQGLRAARLSRRAADRRRAEIKARYAKVKGSAVNPVLREGNSDRRAPKAVKEYAQAEPALDGRLVSDSKTHVSTMGERRLPPQRKVRHVPTPTTLRIEHVAATARHRAEGRSGCWPARVIDGTFMSSTRCVAFLADQIADAKEQACCSRCT